MPYELDLESDSGNEQLVCFCHNVSVATLLKAIREGSTTLHDLQEKTCASTGCGGCEMDVVDVLERALLALPEAAKKR